MKGTKPIYTTAFQDYKNLGLDPLPIPYDENGHPTKGPKIDGWQIKAANGEFTETDFVAPCNIGVLLGGPKNLTDIDCDSPQAVAVAGDIIGHLMQKTGNGTMMFGRASKPRSHYIFFCDHSLPTEKITDPADQQCIIEYRCVKQDGERGVQTVFPPSLRYEAGMTEQIHMEDDSTPVPAFIEAKKLHDCFRLTAAVALLAKHFPVESSRHNTILALAGIFARGGMPEGKAASIISLAYRHSGGFNNDSDKAQADVKSVYTAFAEGSTTTHLFGYPTLAEIMPRAVVDKVLELLGIERPDTNYTLTDAGNGRRLVDKHQDEIRYCVDDGEWYVWDGVRWRRDVVKKIRELGKGIATDLRHEAHSMKPPAPTGDDELDKKALSQREAKKREIVKWANQSENADRVSKTIISAASDSRIICFRTDFDQNGALLNCRNCVVNLYTGETMPHDRKLMMSNLCPVEYESNAAHQVWNESIAAFTRNHPDLTGFLQRIAGYSIQGDKSEERIFLLYGPGNAGKGTFMDWLTNALGPDYACAMDANSVLKQKRNSAAASGDIARLEGKRIVVVSEIEKGKRLEESFMKQASGNDALVARSLYQSEREFRPTHQFWFQTNYRPGFDSTDSGNKRRYVEIPFDNDLSTDPLVKFDAKIKIRMRQDADFLKAVLAWCVQGCIEWRMHGLDIPESVTKATQQLFTHNDFLKDFITEICIADPNEKVPVKDLWDEYKRWCEGQGEEPAQGRTFNRMMEERGFERKQARVNGVSGKAWNGIRLKAHDEFVAGLPEDGSQEDIEIPAKNLKRFPAHQQYTTVFGRKTMVG